MSSPCNWFLMANPQVVGRNVERKMGLSTFYRKRLGFESCRGVPPQSLILVGKVRCNLNQSQARETVAIIRTSLMRSDKSLILYNIESRDISRSI